jgi:RND family efflux transporter MFP subunit
MTGVVRTTDSPNTFNPTSEVMAQSRVSRLGSFVQLLQSISYWLIILAGCAAVVALLLWAAGTFHTKVPSNDGHVSRPIPPDARLATVEKITVPRFETAVGTIQAVRDASVATKILARVEEVNVTAGQQVKAGEVLVRLLNDDLVARLGQFESNRAGAEARQVQAKAEFDRATNLFAKQAISQSEYQSYEADLRAANAELERTKQAIEEAKVQLSFATVTAPFDGVVIDKQVKPGDTAVPGQVLFRIYDPSHMQLVAQVRESLALSLRPGQLIGASISSLGYECQATISEVVPQANSATHSFDVKVVGPCPTGVYSGMFGRLKLPVGNEEVIVLPREAIIRVGQLTMVDVALNGHLELRNVQLGREVDGRLQVLAGLRSEEQVVLRADATEVQR